MARWCAERTTQEAVDTLGKAMIPAGPVLSPLQALEHPHIPATELMQDVDYPGLPSPRRPRVAVRLSETPGKIASRPPISDTMRKRSPRFAQKDHLDACGWRLDHQLHPVVIPGCAGTTITVAGDARNLRRSGTDFADISRARKGKPS